MIIFRQSIKRIFNNKIKLLILLVMPVLFIAMFALQDENAITIGIADKDNSTLSLALIKSLDKIDKVKVLHIEEESAYDKAVSFQTEYTLIIEQGFEDRIIKGEKAEVKEFYINEKEKLFYARNVVDNYINNMKIMASGANHNKDAFFKELKIYNDSKLTVKNLQASGSNSKRTRGAMGFLVQFMLYMSVITSSLLLEDKNSGVFYRTLNGPVSLKRYIFENLLAFLVVAILQVTLTFVLIKFIFGLDLGRNPLNLYLLFIVFSVVCISLGMWIVSIFKKPIAAYTTILLLTTPLLMLGGCYWPMNYMSENFQKVARFFPTTYVMQGTEKILFEGKGLIGISMEIFILLIFSVIFMAGGIVKKVDISK
jgi:ABC-2 type transport system permease protein